MTLQVGVLVFSMGNTTHHQSQHPELQFPAQLLGLGRVWLLRHILHKEQEFGSKICRALDEFQPTAYSSRTSLRKAARIQSRLHKKWGFCWPSRSSATPLLSWRTIYWDPKPSVCYFGCQQMTWGYLNYFATHLLGELCPSQLGQGSKRCLEAWIQLIPRQIKFPVPV